MPNPVSILGQQLQALYARLLATNGNLVAPAAVDLGNGSGAVLVSAGATPLLVASGSGAAAVAGNLTAPVAAGVTGATTIASGPHRLFGVLCTSTGTNLSPTNVTDGPGGTIIAIIPGQAPNGSVVPVIATGQPVANSIVINGATGAPAMTVTYA